MFGVCFIIEDGYSDTCIDSNIDGLYNTIDYPPLNNKYIITGANDTNITTTTSAMFDNSVNAINESPSLINTFVSKLIEWLPAMFILIVVTFICTIINKKL